MRQRRVRRPFLTGNNYSDGYRLPHEIRDRLTAALEPYRNREAAFTLAVFLARFWSSPGRIVEAFHIDRRALVDHGELDLTEKRIRSAIRTLEEIGFLDRALASGSKYQAVGEGLHRKPIRYQFGAEYFPLFDAANKRAAAARGGNSRDRRAITPSKAVQPSAGSNLSALVKPDLVRPPKGPKSKSEADRTVNLGPLVKECGLPALAFDPDPKLEAALARLEEGFRRSRGG